MKVQELFGDKGYLAAAVPLSITDLGFAYLNDIGLWNITINQKNVDCIDNKITIAQLQDIFEHHCTCYQNQRDVLENERQKMLEKIKMFDTNEIIDFS